MKANTILASLRLAPKEGNVVAAHKINSKLLEIRFSFLQKKKEKKKKEEKKQRSETKADEAPALTQDQRREEVDERGRDSTPHLGLTCRRRNGRVSCFPESN